MSSSLLAPFLSLLLAPSAPQASQLVLGPEQQVLPGDLAANHWFGNDLELDGERLLIGTWNPRSVYVFELVGTTWTEVQQIQRPPARWGAEVALKGDTMAVCNGGTSDDVQVWIFERQAGTWTEVFQDTLPSTSAVDSDLWIDGDRVFLGAPFDAAFLNPGQVQTYRKTGGSWAREQTLTVPGMPSNHFFGVSVAADADRLLVGADGPGLVYAYHFDGASWVFDETFQHPTLVGQRFGRSVSIEGTRAVVGATFDSTHGFLAGSAHVFELVGGSWTHVQELLSGNPASDNFGSTTDLEGDRILVGGAGPDDAHLFAWDGTSWTNQNAFPSLPADSIAQLSISQGRIALGAPAENVGFQFSGAAYVWAFGSVQTFCDASDGSLASCPCSNPGLPDTGCDNAQGTGGVKAEITSLDPFALSATLSASGFPPMGSPTAIVIRATNLEPTPVPFFDGIRCIGLNGFVRFGAVAASGGISTHTIAHGAGPGSFHYQVWYRNTPITFCDAAAAANTSSGQTVSW